MNRKKFSEAMNELDDKYIEKSINYRAKKSKTVWLKWGAVAACLCLVVGVVSISNMLFWRAACGHIEHDITIIGEQMYYACDGNIYFYDYQAEKSEKISSINGDITLTESGLCVLENSNGNIYSVNNFDLVQLGKIASDSTLIDLIDGVAFYRSHHADGAYTIEKKDLKSDATTVLVSVPNGYVGNQIIIGDKLYYEFSYENSYEICEINLPIPKQSSTIKLNDIFDSEVNSVEFFNDFMLIETAEGLYSMDYQSQAVAFLSEYRPISGALDFYDGKLYFVASFPADGASKENYQENLISVDVKSKKFSIVTQLTKHDGTVTTYTEIAVTENGYYYTEPSNSVGGLFYHPFDDSQEKTIHKN